MTNDELANRELSGLLEDKSEEWRAGFFAAVNLNSDMKAAFLRNFIGAHVSVVEVPPRIEGHLVIDPPLPDELRTRRIGDVPDVLGGKK